MTETMPIYRAIMAEIERRRIELGVPMWKLDSASGIQDGYYPKMLYPDTPSGKRANWPTLQNVVDVLYPGGFVVQIKPSPCAMDAGQQRVSIKFSGARYDHEARKDWFKDVASKGGVGRKNKLTPERRAKIARRAAKKRWRTPKIVEITPDREEPKKDACLASKAATLTSASADEAAATAHKSQSDTVSRSSKPGSRS
jgi:hypothetical protein